MFGESTCSSKKCVDCECAGDDKIALEVGMCFDLNAPMTVMSSTTTFFMRGEEYDLLW